MKKLVMLVAAAAAIAAQAEQSVVPSTSYVQRGLLCHFDALDNAGRGTHSSSATTWVDLTGNGNDATVHFVDAKGNALKGHWGSRALCSTGSTDGVYADFVPSSALLDKVNSDGPWTYEVVDCQDCTRHGTSYEFGCSGVFGKNQGSNDLRGYFYIRGANTGWTDVNKASSYCSRPHVIAYVHDGTNISRYRDGVVDSDWATVAAPKGSKPMTVSQKLQILYQMFGDVFAVRFYDRVLSLNELKYNVEVDRDRFFARSAKGLSTVETADATALKVKVTAKCPAGSGTVAIDGGTAGESVEKVVDFGANVTIAFAPTAGQASHGWANVPLGTDTSGASVTFTADRAVNAHVLTAARTVHYVSTTGDNTNDGSQLSPWRSIQHAVANSAVKEFDEIRIGGGPYEENVFMSSTKAYLGSVGRLTLKGSYDVNWTRDLVFSRTIIRPPAHSGLAIQIQQSFSNVVDGVDLTGAQQGFGFADELDCGKIDGQNGKYQSTYATNLRHCFITNNYSHGTGPFGFRSIGEQPRMGIQCTSCFIADNGGWGFGSDALDSQSGCRHFVNCTIVRNAGGGIRNNCTNRGRTSWIRNVILADNGGPILKADICARLGFVYIFNSLLRAGAGGKTFVAADGAGVGDGGSTPAVPIMYDIFACDPQLGADGHPAAASHANKSGQDVDDVIAGTVDDIYGNVWTAGAYDVGCFKTSHALPVTRRSLDHVFVSKSGSDSAAGDSADAAVATLDEALWRVRPRGVCHLGAGRFADGIPVASTDGIRIEGEGPNVTSLSGPDGGTVSQSAFQVAASNVVLVGCTFTNGVYGVSDVNSAKCGWNIAATNCAFVGNGVGYRQFGYAYEMGYNSWIQRLSRCSFCSNRNDGAWSNQRILLDSCLLANNGRYGYYLNGHDANKESGILNCTIAGNGSYGIYKPGGGNNSSLTLRNCIVAGHGCGIFPGDNGAVNWQYTLFDNLTNQLYSTTLKSTLNGMTDSCITNRAALLVGGDNPLKKYRITPESPAFKSGSRAMYPWENTSPTKDLTGVKWSRKLDMGCYCLPLGTQILVR